MLFGVYSLTRVVMPALAVYLPLSRIHAVLSPDGTW